MALRQWDTPYRPFRLTRQLSGAAIVSLMGVGAFYLTQAMFGSITPTYNQYWENETKKYAVAIKADPISHPEVRGNLADTPQYDYFEKKKGK